MIGHANANSFPTQPVRPAGRLLRRLRVIFCALVWLALLFPVYAVAGPNVPQRIISMSPSITEFLFELGAGDRVVGVTNFCVYPKEACTRPKIGGLLNPSVETWITLQPDLIIHQATSHKLREHARNLNIPTLSVDMENLDSIFDSVLKMGTVLDCEEAARRVVSRLKAGIAHYQKILAGHKKKSVLLLLGGAASADRDLYAVSRAAFLGELLELAGGRNIVRDTTPPYPKINKEYILEQSPEVIIEVGPAPGMSPEEKSQRIEEWQRFPTIRAVAEGNIHFIGADHILIPGPRLLKTLDDFARVLHPELFGNKPQTARNG